MSLQACVERTKDSRGEESATLHLRFRPDQKFEGSPQPPQEVALSRVDTQLNGSIHPEQVRGSVTPPKAIFHPEAQFSDDARQKKIEGNCLVGLTVDARGMPQDIHLRRTLEASLDEQAIEAVRRYRFKPAMKNGLPIPVSIAVEVRFRLREIETAWRAVNQSSTRGHSPQYAASTDRADT